MTAAARTKWVVGVMVAGVLLLVAALLGLSVLARAVIELYLPTF